MEFLCGQDGVGEELRWAELGASEILAAEVSESSDSISST
jgi:hypothetical protein